MGQLFRVMRCFLVISLKHVSVRGLQIHLHPARVSRTQALVLANALKRAVRLSDQRASRQGISRPSSEREGKRCLRFQPRLQLL